MNDSTQPVLSPHEKTLQYLRTFTRFYCPPAPTNRQRETEMARHIESMTTAIC